MTLRHTTAVKGPLSQQSQKANTVIIPMLEMENPTCTPGRKSHLRNFHHTAGSVCTGIKFRSD